MDIAINNVTAVTMLADGPVLYDASVGISGGKIEKISEKPLKAARVIDGAGKVLMPGLYNCHTHASMTLLRGFANDLSLEDWLFNHIFPAEKKLTPKIVRVGTALAIAEMVASGTVSFSDMYFFTDEAAIAADEAGVMANVSNAVIGFDADSYDFYKDRVYGQTVNVIKEYHNKKDGRIKAEASIHGVYTSFAPAWAQVTDFADEYGLRLHVHISETKTEHNNCVGNYGMTPAQVFQRHGIFKRKVNAAHCAHVTDRDIEILAENGASVAHCPVSNLKLASGIAPVKRMVDAGVNVTLGTDGMASNNSHDLFEEIKLASILQKNTENDPTVLPALHALRMATVNGAVSQGREKESGVVAEGFDANLILIDFDNPRLTPCHDPVVSLAYSATGRDVAMTMCKGKILYENGEHKTIDTERIISEAREIAKIFTL